MLQARMYHELEHEFQSLGFIVIGVSATAAKSAATGMSGADKTRVIDGVKKLFSKLAEEVFDKAGKADREAICDATAIALGGAKKAAGEGSR